MRGLLSLTAAVLVAAVAAPAHASELSTAGAAAGPILVPGGALWSDDGDRLLIRPDAADVPLPPPGPVPAGPYGELEVRGAHADALAHADGLVAVRRGIYSCWPSQPGELTTSCNSPLEVLAGPTKGPFVRVSPPHACRRLQGADTVALAAGRVVVAEGGVECRGDVEAFESLVTIDPRDPSQRRVLATGTGFALRAAGDLVAWTTQRRRTIVVFDVARGLRVRTLRAGGGWFSVWDVQEDGTVVAGVLPRGGEPYRLRPVVYEPGRAARTLPGTIAPHVQLARDRIAAHWPRRFAVVDLRGRSRRVGRERPAGIFDFDGRRATWVRIRVLDGPRPCPSDPGPSSCEERPARVDVSLRLAVVAR